MKVLVACEYSGVVRDAFIKLGHEAVSCDLLDTDQPGPHYKGDVFDIIDQGWDLMIAHPPCTYLCVTGARWLYNKDKTRNEQRWKDRAEALQFVRDLLNCSIPRVALENPISCISTEIRKPDQIIKPCWFGDDASKKTCLWLKNLPLLEPTDIIEPTRVTLSSGKTFDKWYYDTSCISNLKERAKVRSKTFQGIADAMAQQWGAL